jgi:hypothetical protein
MKTPKKKFRLTVVVICRIHEYEVTEPTNYSQVAMEVITYLGDPLYTLVGIVKLKLCDGLNV